ncbi:reverse transcriptase domain-containing protein [Mucilaginibacter gotjawali]|uniref:RNA-directed DNA polymerase n=1 Tax=Mucilaginibacter gotjawali TaxID=1550579 RepID=A0A839SE15_9SPHI|nr:reverse transcriptase domain-containing protein [Mucilaginibacter gotjawali]MBB3054787.1 RNA-directed DNA polymerase [Mucilaginibacter gotjawali]
MELELYKRRFTEKALATGYSAEKIERCLKYAEKLLSYDLPVIYNLEHLCALVGYHSSYLLRAVDHPNFFYRSFKIKKNNNQFRDIDEPLPSLKEIQDWILTNILYQIAPSKYAKAYVPGTSLKQNILFHRDQPIVLTMDIKDFFPSVKRSQITALFFRLGYSIAISDLLAKLCCLNDCLPQGASTSPYLSNLILASFDDAIAVYCIPLGIRYTRYADDLTFSGKFDCEVLKLQVIKHLSIHGLKINEQKTRIMRFGERQIVTGVVVNKKMQVSKEKRMAIRQQMHFIKRFGLEEHMKARKLSKGNYVRHLLGKINFILYINPDDLEFIKYRDDLLKLGIEK